MKVFVGNRFLETPTSIVKGGDRPKRPGDRRPDRGKNQKRIVCMFASSNKARCAPPLPLLVAALAAVLSITFALAYAYNSSPPGSSDDDDDRPRDGNETDDFHEATQWMRKDRSESDATPRTANGAAAAGETTVDTNKPRDEDNVTQNTTKKGVGEKIEEIRSVFVASYPAEDRGKISTTKREKKASTDQERKGRDQEEGMLVSGDQTHHSTLDTSSNPASTATCSNQLTPNLQTGKGSASFLSPVRVNKDEDEPEPPTDLVYNKLSTYWKEKEVRHSFVQPGEMKQVSCRRSSSSLKSKEMAAMKEEKDTGTPKVMAGKKEEEETLTNIRTSNVAILGVDTAINAEKEARGEYEKPKDYSTEDNDSRLILPSSSEESSSGGHSSSSKGSSDYVKIVRTPAGDAMTESEFLLRPLVVVDGAVATKNTKEGGDEDMLA